MIRVLFVSGSVPPTPCGVGDYTLKLAESLVAQGTVQAAILTTYSSQPPISSPVEIISELSGWSLGQALAVIRVIKRWKPDLIHIQYPTQGYGKGLLPNFIPMIARVCGKQSVQTLHEGFGRRHALRLVVQLLANSHFIIVRSNFMERVHPSLQSLLKNTNPTLIKNASAIPKTSCSVEQIQHEKLQLLGTQKRLLMFFGFLYPAKGVEHLFEIADSSTDHILIAGQGEKNSPYLAKLMQVANTEPWAGKVTFTGFVSPEKVALLLSAADAVILPFRDGGGSWNTSIHSATLNGTFVITTSVDTRGYDSANNVFYCLPDDLSSMRAALQKYCGKKTLFGNEGPKDDGDWPIIARKHYDIYVTMLTD